MLHKAVTKLGVLPVQLRENKVKFFQNALKLFLEDIFRRDFFKPQVLIEIRRLRMFLIGCGHMRHPIPLLEHGGSPKYWSETWISIHVSDQDLGDPPCSRTGMGCLMWPETINNMRNRRISMSTCGLKKISPKKSF